MAASEVADTVKGYAPAVSDRFLVSAAELFGDGVFETVHLRPDGPWLLSAHLDRLERSASLLFLDLPPRARLRAEIGSPSASPEGALRILVTRESIHVTVGEIGPAVRRERRSGVRVLSADLGCAVARRPPWSLAAAKSLSYASNFAARRWAARHQADDVVWLSTEGYVLEAPTASIVWLAGDVLCTIPPSQAPILPGITAAHLLSSAGAIGLRAEERMVTLPSLASADAIWLASSLRGLAEVVALDGVERARSPWTERLQRLLGFDVSGPETEEHAG
jgi:4-amino-4-deoxychorismate lyase